MTHQNIRKQIRAELPLLRQKYHVKRLGIFGSYARGEERRGSDIDIMVEFSQPVGFFTFVRLEGHLGRLLHKKVDLVTKKALKPAIKKAILKELKYV